MNIENFFQGAKKAILTGSVAAIASGGIGPRPAEAGDPQSNSQAPANPGVVQRGEFGQGYTGPRFTTETQPPQTNIFARAEAVPAQEAPMPLEFVLANVRVDTAVRARERIPVVLDENLTNPQGELQAQFSITKTPSPQGNIWRLYESWMDRGQQTEHNPVANEPLPMKAVRGFAVFPNGDVLVGGEDNGPSVKGNSGFGRETARWQPATIHGDNPRGEGQVLDLKKITSTDPNVPVNKNMAVFSVYGGNEFGAELQIVGISNGQIETPIRTGIKHNQIIRILEAQSTPDGQSIAFVISTSDGLIEAEYNKQTGQKKEEVIDGPGHHIGLKRYKTVVAEGYTVIDELGGIVVDKNTRTGQVQKIGFKHLVDQANLQNVLPGTFSAKAAYVTETDKGSLKLLLPGSRAVSNEPLGVKTVAKLDLYIPGQTPPHASSAQDLDYDVKGTVGSTQKVMMGGNEVIKLLQIGTGSSTYSDARRMVVNTDKGLERTQRTTESTPNPEPTPVPTPSPTPTQTGNITYSARLPVVARNGSPQTAQSTTTRR